MTKDSEFKLGGDAEFEAWRIEMVAADHNICAQAQYDTLLETVKYTKLCGLSAVDVVTSSDWCAKRVSSDLRHDGANDYKLLFQVSGHSRLTMAQDDTATELGTGDLGLVDVTRQIHLAPHGEPGRWIGLHLPRQALLCHLGFEPKGGLHWRSDAFPARLLLRFLLDAIDENDVIFQTSQAYLQHAIFNMIGALFGQSELPSHFSQSDKLFLRLCSIVKRHFADPNVGPTEIAAEAGISLRYLQKLFAMRGTTYGHFIKSYRLNHAADILEGRSAMQTKLPLTEIARACGYRDYAHFARNFRTRYGQTPGTFDRSMVAPE
jgi:AraC-like DNA-binding protein